MGFSEDINGLVCLGKSKPGLPSSSPGEIFTGGSEVSFPSTPMRYGKTLGKQRGNGEQWGIHMYPYGNNWMSNYQ